jgi:hypothetical protein
MTGYFAANRSADLIPLRELLNQTQRIAPLPNEPIGCGPIHVVAKLLHQQ